MRNFLITVGLFFSFAGYALAGSRDIYSSDRPAVWRASVTATQDPIVRVATGAIHFHGIIIGSATVNIADSRLILYNSTSPNVSSVGASTGPIIDLGTRIYTIPPFNAGSSSPTVVISAPREKIEYDIPLSSGLVYDKRGNSHITILWDYVFPFPPSDNSQPVRFSP